MTDDTDAAATDRASEVFSALDETADWQGLGIQVPESICRDPKKIVKHAGLNWRAEKRECFYRTSAEYAAALTRRTGHRGNAIHCVNPTLQSFESSAC